MGTCRLVVFIDIKRYILIEGKNVKTFLKEKYAIALGSCYLFTKLSKNIEHGIEHGVLIVLMDFVYIRHSCRLYNRFNEYLEI